jgi:hypothetical protein
MVNKNKSYWKKRAWKAFSLYIRTKYAGEEGLAICYTCGKVDHWKKLQAGHGIAGRNNAVLFQEDIVKPQCVGCNVYGRGKTAIFTRKLIEELGMSVYDYIVKESNKTVQYKSQDYIEIEKKYKDKLLNL